MRTEVAAYRALEQMEYPAPRLLAQHESRDPLGAPGYRCGLASLSPSTAARHESACPAPMLQRRLGHAGRTTVTA